MALSLRLRGAYPRVLASQFLRANNSKLHRCSLMMRPYTSLTANTGRSQTTAKFSSRPMVDYKIWFLTVDSEWSCKGLQDIRVRPTGKCSTFQQYSDASSEKGIRNVKLADAEGVAEVEWFTGGVSKYPYVWLRDNCQCPRCYDSEYSNSLIMMSDLDPEIVPVGVETRDGGGSLYVTWPDGHRSRYDWQWLRDRCFSPRARADREQRWKGQKQLWGADIAANLPTSDFPALLTDDRALYDFLYGLDTVGLVLVRNVSRDVGQVEKLANRVAFLKQTVYGTVYQVTYQPTDVSVGISDTTGPLELHMNGCFYHYGPGVQMMHFIQQTKGEGGASHLADGFNAAHQLREEDPEAFRLLNAFKVAYIQKRGKDKSHFRNRCRVISTDDQGDVEHIRYQTFARESLMEIRPEQIKPFYRALTAFNAILYRPKNLLRLKMKTGEMFVCDNRRVLHGRTAFNPADGMRHLEGGYLDWDEVYFRIRVLQAELGILE